MRVPKRGIALWKCSVSTNGGNDTEMMICLAKAYDLLLFIYCIGLQDLYDSEESILIYLFRLFVLPMKAHVISGRCGGNIFHSWNIVLVTSSC